MKKHIKIYCDYFNIGPQDICRCEYCGAFNASEIHHVKFKSAGGKDEITNLIGICKACHLRGHHQLEPYITEEDFNKIIEQRDGNS